MILEESKQRGGRKREGGISDMKAHTSFIQLIQSMACGPQRKWKDFGSDFSCRLSCSQVKQQTRTQVTNAIKHNSIIAAMLSNDIIWYCCFPLNQIKPLDKTTEWQLLSSTWIYIKHVFFQHMQVTQYAMVLPGKNQILLLLKACQASSFHHVAATYPKVLF